MTTDPAPVPGQGRPGDSPLTGDEGVDSVLQRLRAELADLAVDDLGGRRAVLAEADAALRALLDAAPDADPAAAGSGA